MRKIDVTDLAIFSGKPVFSEFKSTSNLFRPDFHQFCYYSEQFFTRRHYSNDGPLVKLLESRLAEFHQVNHCIAVSSGFWGLVLAIKCLALPQKNEVIMPSLTYRRMADVVAWTGLIPHFCEVDPNTLAIDAETAKEALTENTALILGVHPIVNCCDVEGLTQLSETFGIPLLFDSVESVYETCAGKKVGTFGNAECFSLHASKLINGFEGGYITTNDEKLAERLRHMRSFGFYGQDNIQDMGINAKLNEIHAAMALASLDGLDEQVSHNYLIYKAYQNGLKNVSGIRILTFNEQERSSFKNIVIELLDDWPVKRATTLDILHAEKILARPYYSPALHQKKTSYPVRAVKMRQSNLLAERFMLLPCGYMVNESDVERVVDLLKFINNHANTINERLQK